MSNYTGAVPDTLEPAEKWRDQGACQHHDNPDTWYATGGSEAGRAEQREAQAICFSCPVRVACGKWALDNGERFGVWGGMTESQRRRVLRQRAAATAELGAAA